MANSLEFDYVGGRRGGGGVLLPSTRAQAAEIPNILI